MASALTINGVTYQYPVLGDENWGPDASSWASAVTSGLLQKSGGTFILTNEVDFGALNGLKALSYKSRSSNIASAGIVRLSHTDTIQFRNLANSGNLSLLPNAASDVLSFNGIDLVDLSTVQTLSNKTFGGTTFTGTILLPNGTAANPSFAWANEANSGAYRNSALHMRFSINQNDVFEWGAALNQSFVPLGIPDGSVSAPGLALAGSPTNGIYKGGTNVLAFATNGIAAGNVNASQVWSFPNGANVNGLGLGLSANVISNISSMTSTGAMVFQTNGSTTALTLSIAQKATFAGDVAVSGVTTLTGVTDGSTASSGKVGEVLFGYSGGGGSPTFVSAPTSTQYGDVASLALTAGDWDIWAVIESRLNTGVSLTNQLFGIGTATGNASTGLVNGKNFIANASIPNASTDSGMMLPAQPISIAGSTTYYLKMNLTYSSGTPQVRGTLFARRLR